MNKSFDSMWQGEDVFVLGGGPSLKRFDVALLKDRKVIGCNDAYLFGEDVVDILVFGDYKWWLFHKDALIHFTNPIVTNHEKLEDDEKVYWMPRKNQGFHKDALGWNGNTGAVAINLALIMGATRIFLLGFDMSLNEKGESNWHQNDLDKPTEEHYFRYKDNIVTSANHLRMQWPDVHIINLNPDSCLECFPKSTWNSFFPEPIGVMHE